MACAPLLRLFERVFHATGDHVVFRNTAGGSVGGGGTGMDVPNRNRMAPPKLPRYAPVLWHGKTFIHSRQVFKAATTTTDVQCHLDGVPDVGTVSHKTDDRLAA